MIFTFLIILSCTCCAFADNHSEQIIRANVPEVLHIEKIIVENVEYDKDDELKNMQIRRMEILDKKCCRMSLCPFSVRITTNPAEPI